LQIEGTQGGNFQMELAKNFGFNNTNNILLLEDFTNMFGTDITISFSTTTTNLGLGLVRLLAR
jgi:hypothetical protein